MSALLGTAALLAVTGCATAIPTSDRGPANLSADHAYLVDQGGHAVYLWVEDTKGRSNCTDACASVWPPYETSRQPTAGKGVAQSKLGTITRTDGSRQVTYAGVPLYYYAGDGGQRDKTTGEGSKLFGADWYLVSPKDGAPVESVSKGGS